MRKRKATFAAEYQRMGPMAQKVLLLLLAGVSLSLAMSRKRRMRVFKEARKEWLEINRVSLYRTIRKLYISRLVHMTENKDGSTTVVLSEKGKNKALTYNLEALRIVPMKRWDGKWRMVAFDIPEGRKKARDALARVLKNAGFYKLQKSIFIHPFECKDEIDFVIEFFNVRPYVRTILVSSLDNEIHLRKIFRLRDLLK